MADEPEDRSDRANLEAFLSSEETIAFFAKLRGISLEEARAQLKELRDIARQAKE